MGKLGVVGWIVALAVAGVSYAAYDWLLEERETALGIQATDHEAQIGKIKADYDAQLQKLKDDTAAQLQAMQADLNLARMPALPLKFAFRGNQVLYVESESGEVFFCTIRLTRPSNGATVDVDFSINPRAFRDLAALGQWVFQRGDKIEFMKPGLRSWSGEFP